MINPSSCFAHSFLFQITNLIVLLLSQRILTLSLLALPTLRTQIRGIFWFFCVPGRFHFGYFLMCFWFSFFFFFLYVKCLKKLLLLIENCNSLHVSTYTIYSPKLVTPNTCSLSYMLVKIYIPHVSVCSLYIDISASGLHLPFVFQLLIYVLVYNLPELISYVLSEFFLVFSLKPIPILILISRGAAD